MVIPSAVPDTASPRILLVEDDEVVRRALQLLLRSQGYDVRAYPSAVGLSRDQEALGASCLVADLVLPQINAIELLVALRAVGWAGHAILISGHLTADSEEAARQAGYARILPKPITDAALTRAVADLLNG